MTGLDSVPDWSCDIICDYDLSPQHQYLLSHQQKQPEPTIESCDLLQSFLTGKMPITNLDEGTSMEEYPPLEKALLELPIEVWDIIVDLATYVPGSYDIRDDSSIAAFTSDSSGIYARSRFESSLRDKVALSQVCRRLYAIVRNFILEHIHINSATRAIAIAKLLKNRTHSGERTRRIDLDLEGSQDWKPQHTKAMISMLQSCPNIVCFSAAFCDTGPALDSIPKLLKSLAHHKHLKRIESKLQRNGDVLRRIETYHPNLEVLWTLPTWEVRFRETDHYNLPKLRALIVTDRNLVGSWTMHVPKLEACISENGGIPTIPVQKRSQMRYIHTFHPQEFIPGLGAWCNLHTLSICYTALQATSFDWPQNVQIPTMRCVVIEEVRSTWGGYLEENLERITSPDIFPNLECVKLHLSFSKVSLAKLESSIRREWLGICVERGLRIEMLQGSMERSANEWKVISHESLKDAL